MTVAYNWKEYFQQKARQLNLQVTIVSCYHKPISRLRGFFTFLADLAFCAPYGSPTLKARKMAFTSSMIFYHRSFPFTHMMIYKKGEGI